MPDFSRWSFSLQNLLYKKRATHRIQLQDNKLSGSYQCTCMCILTKVWNLSFNQIQWEVWYYLYLSSWSIRKASDRTHLTTILQVKAVSVCSFDEKHCWDAGLSKICAETKDKSERTCNFSNIRTRANHMNPQFLNCLVIWKVLAVK